MDEKNAIVADARFEPSPPGITIQTAPDLDQTFWYVQESSLWKYLSKGLEGAAPKDRLAHRADNVLLLHDAVHLTKSYST